MFSAFGPTSCPRLRKLKASYYCKGAHELLCEFAKHPSISCNLAFYVATPDGVFDPAMLLCTSEEHPELPIKLRMMEVDLNRQWYTYDRSAKEILKDLVLSNGGSLEALVLNISDQDAD